MTQWRFISHETYDGAMNMAIDEAILEQHLAGETPPTLRLYGFNPAAVTIGYAQRMAPDVIARIKAAGIEVVRRPTGGRAVLHLNELTYSFVGLSSDPADELGFLQPSINGAYRQICRGLILALAELGVEAELGQSDSSYRQMEDCFLATTTADLHHKGKKMAGSAQCRRGRGVLQHGSILLDQDQGIMNKLLTGRDDANDSTRHANLFDILLERITLERLETVLKNGFEQAFAHEFVPTDLSQSELRLAAQRRSTFELQQPVPTN